MSMMGLETPIIAFVRQVMDFEFRTLAKLDFGEEEYARGVTESDFGDACVARARESDFGDAWADLTDALENAVRSELSKSKWRSILTFAFEEAAKHKHRQSGRTQKNKAA
jgi:hypothetical protein